MRPPILFAAAALLWAASPSGAEAQLRRTHVHDNQVAWNLYVGYGGDLEVGRAEADLDTTVGVGFRFEAGLHRYVAVGFLAAILAWEVDAPRTDKSGLFDFDGYLKLRYPFFLGDASAEVYGLVPVGLTVSATDAYGEDDAGLGWNVGGFLGFLVALHRSIALFAEVGFWHHQATHEVGRVEVEGNTDQAYLSVGVALLL